MGRRKIETYKRINSKNQRDFHPDRRLNNILSLLQMSTVDIQ